MTSVELSDVRVNIGTLEGLPVNTVFLRQVHGAKIATIKSYSVMRPVADGAWIPTTNVVVGILSADCLPLILASPMGVLALHVSRKSLIVEQLERVVQFLPPTTITGVFIGPHICAQHFTFQNLGEEIEKFHQLFPYAWEQTDCVRISLQKVVMHYLKQWQVAPKIIFSDPRCTYENVSLYSYRRWREKNTTMPLSYNITCAQRR
ncbi:MAG: polyphenol oxidase family protein [Candidatus Andersenbacteria bacterium]